MCSLCDINQTRNPCRIHRRAFIAGAISGAFISEAATAEKFDNTPKPQNIISPDAALQRLIEGNQRFLDGSEKKQNFRSEREALLVGQNPFAAVLSCADSRLAPSYIFDIELGDVFNIRVAGNIAAPEVVASFEYAVHKLNTPLLMVLGHEKCGAVDAALKTVKTGERLPGHLPLIADDIAPALEGIHSKSLDDELAIAINHNIKINVSKLKAASPILNHAVESRKIRVVGGLYRLESGKVDILYP
ncbi:MAG: carbonic anhydrase [Methylocystis sp.]